MAGFLAMAKINFLNLLLTTSGLGRNRNGKGKQRSGIAALLFIGILMAFISSNYSFTLSAVLGPLGGLDLVLMLMLAVGIFFSIAITLYSSQGLLFSVKDIDLVLSLPVSTFSVLLSKLLALYLEILFMMELFLIPAGIAFLVNGGGGGAAFLLLLILAGVLLSFIPAFLSLVFGSIIGLLIAKTRFKNLFNTLFSLLLLVGIFVIIFFASSRMDQLDLASIPALRSAMMGALPPLAWAVQGVTQPNVLLLLLLALACLAPFFLFTLLISRFYKKLLTSLLSQHVRSDYRVKGLAAKSGFAALLGKEARRFFGTPAYLLNAGMGMVLMLLGAVAMLIFQGSIREVLAQILGIPILSGATAYFPPILLGLCCFFFMTFTPSSVSISLEGKTLWILKESPLSTGAIFMAKVGLQVLMGAICTIPSILVAGYVLRFTPLDTVLVLLLALAFLLLSAITGLVINLKYPRLDADNDTIVVKQSASVIFTLLATLLEGALLIGLYFLLGPALGFTLFSLAGLVLLLGGSALFCLWLRGRGTKIFTQLY